MDLYGVDTPTLELFATARLGQSRVTTILPKLTPKERHEKHFSRIKHGCNESNRD